MNRLQALGIAVAAASSMHASAATITLQDSAAFDISADYSNGFNFAGEITLAPNETQVNLQAELHGPGLNLNILGYTDAAAALNNMLMIWSGDEYGNFVRFNRIDDYFSAIELGVPYEFSYSANVIGFNTPGCASPSEECGGGDYQVGPFAFSTIVFYDSAALDVPVAPTAPLLVAGLAGLWMRRKSA